MFTVLYTDDEPALLEIGKAFLERSGPFTVETALSAHDAFETLKAGPVDCIVSDYLMPEMNGIEFLKALRGKGARIPFILFTGRGSYEIDLEAMQAGVPIVASGVGGIPHALDDGRAGFLCVPGSVGMLKQGVLEVINNPVDAGKRAEAAQRRVDDLFSSRAMALKYLDIYCQVAEVTGCATR